MPKASRASWLFSKAVAQEVANQMITYTRPLPLLKTSRLVIPERNQVLVIERSKDGKHCDINLRN